MVHHLQNLANLKFECPMAREMLRLMQARHELVRRADVDALIDQIAGTVLTHLSRMAARCSRDIMVPRNIDAVVDQIRRELAAACLAKADQ
jgi:Mg2+/Co2+ transporter CorC